MKPECPQCGLCNPPETLRCECGCDLLKGPEVEASRLGVCEFLFSLDGRVGRSSYWRKFLLPYCAIYLILLTLDRRFGSTSEKEVAGLLSGIFSLCALVPAIGVGVKRCHDRDRSGFFLLIGLVPVLNLWPAIELLFVAGTVGPNRYGLPEVRQP